jgi:isopenicillin-N epimerase
VLQQMLQRGAVSWTSPDPALRCGITTVSVAPLKMPDLELWMMKEKKIRIRGGVPSKIRQSTPYYVLHKDVDRYLAAYDEYRKAHSTD